MLSRCARDRQIVALVAVERDSRVSVYQNDRTLIISVAFCSASLAVRPRSRHCSTCFTDPNGRLSRFKRILTHKNFLKGRSSSLKAAKLAFIDDSIAFCSARHCDSMKSERDLAALGVHHVGSESDLDAMALRSRSASIEMNRAMSVLNAAANLPNRLKVAREIDCTVP